jgi:exosortase A-associated hydrolase 1
MNFSEEVLVFQLSGERLIGLVARPDVPADCGVLIVVGGPQYRVGSHRQFLLLSRRLAAEGYPALRFDYRGMGDSEGAMRSFEGVSGDIEAAIDALLLDCPTVKRVVLWGLCDAASAALLYVQATKDLRVAGLILLNPWVRSEASLAQTHIKHYYGQRLMQREFWVKLAGGKMQLLKSIRGLLSSAMLARGKGVEREDAPPSFQDRMAEGLKQFPGVVLLILSGQDYTAKEFLEFVGSSALWSGLLDAGKITRIDVPDADHTFSSNALRSTVENGTLQWLRSMQMSC